MPAFAYYAQEGPTKAQRPHPRPHHLTKVPQSRKREEGCLRILTELLSAEEKEGSEKQ